MRKKLIPFAVITVLLMSSASCNMPSQEIISGENPYPPTVTIEGKILETGTFTSMPLTVTPSITFTTTPPAPFVTVSIETNCRSGPGTSYDVLAVLHEGETAEVVGRSAAGDNWIIRHPSIPTVPCWLWGRYATVTGDWQSLSIVTPPPTPTPSATFTFSYRFWGVGPGYQCMLFDVTNTGGTTWQSYRLSLHNTTHGESASSPANVFINFDNWCTATETLLDLTPGESGTASVIMHMAHDFSGDNFDATLTLCSQDDLTGNCVTKTINY